MPVVVAESSADDEVRTALADLGFLPLQDGWVKFVIAGMLPCEPVADARRGDRDDRPRHRPANLYAAFASRHDHGFPAGASPVPAKIADVDVPSFIVPIQPDYRPGLVRREARQTEALRGGS